MKQLPTYKGWTIDKKLKEFRQVLTGIEMGEEYYEIVTIPFDTDEGDQLLAEYIKVTGDYQGIFE